jgi:WD40 repeat protein
MREAIIWNRITGDKITSLRGHTQFYSDVALSPDATRAATCSWDGTVILWDAVTGQSLLPPLRVAADRVNSLCFSPDGKRLVSGASDGVWQIFRERLR